MQSRGVDGQETARPAVGPYLGGAGAEGKVSTVWKTCFHGVEKRQKWLPWCGSFPETCFHGVEKWRK